MALRRYQHKFLQPLEIDQSNAKTLFGNSIAATTFTASSATITRAVVSRVTTQNFFNSANLDYSGSVETLLVCGDPNVSQGQILHIRNNNVSVNDTDVFGGIKFSSSPGADFIVGKSTQLGTGFLEVRRENGTKLTSLNGSGDLTLQTGKLIVKGPSNPSSYGLSGGIMVQPGNGNSGLTLTSGSATDNAYINFSKGTASNAEQFAFAIGRDGTANQGIVKIDDVDVARFSSNGIVMPSGKNILNSSGNIILKQSGSVVQTQYISSGTRTTLDTTTFTEPGTSYRLSIQPTSNSNYIILHYFIPMQCAGTYNANTIFSIRAWREIGGGARSYALSSAGNSNGSRNVIAGITFRPNNGTDANDPGTQSFTVFDFPGTTSGCVYGFELKRETGGGGTIYFGNSADSGSNFGFDSDIVIVAQEIVG